MGIGTQYPKKNDYSEILIPVINTFNKSGIKPNPHEVAAAAYLIKLRTAYWGRDLPIDNVNLLAERGIATGQWDFPDGYTETLKRGARADRLGNPFTSIIMSLKQGLNSMNMNRPNAWIDWMEATNDFYTRTSFIQYFIQDYKNGTYADLYMKLSGYIKHTDAYYKGLIFDTLTDGTGTALSPGKTTITFNSTDPGDENSYYVIYTDATNATVFWYNFGGGAEPVVVIPGVTVVYVEYLIDPSLPAADFSVEIQNQSVGVIGFDSITQVDTSAVEYITSATDTRPSSDFAAMPVTWDGEFIDGTPDSPSMIQEVFEIDFEYAVSTDLANRFFMIYDTTGLSTLLYYNLDGAGTFVPPVGLVPDATVAIEIITADTAADILTATQTELDGLGTVTTSVAGLILTVTYIAIGSVTNVDQGTARTGVNYTYFDELIASDATVLASGIANDEEYAEAWNTLRVPYESTLGKTYQFLNSYSDLLGIRGGIWNCCSDSQGCPPGSISKSTSPCPRTNFEGYFRVQIFDPVGLYNTPGNTFDAIKSSRNAQALPSDQM